MAFETTNNYSAFQRFLYLKKELSISYKNVDLVQCCAIDFIDIIVCSAKKNIKDIGSCFLSELVVHPIIDAFANNDIVFSYNFPKRKDHLKLAQTINDSLQKSSLITLHYKRTLSKSLVYFIKYFFKIRKHIPEVSLINKCFIAARMGSYHNTIDLLEKIGSDIHWHGKKYIGFLASAYTECLLTLYFKTKGVQTYHVFHGVFGKYIQFITDDIVNTVNVVADFALPFSESQRQFLIEYSKLPEERVCIAGNPKYPTKKIKLSTLMRRCAILGGIRSYDDAFVELLPILNNIASEENIIFDLKPHPLSQLLSYPTTQKCTNINCVSNKTTLQELLQSGNYDFAIVHNTTAYYECMYYGVIPLRWGKDENLDLNGFDDKFYDKESFLQLLNKYRNMDAEELSKKFEDILVYELGMGINNYNSIINGN